MTAKTKIPLKDKICEALRREIVYGTLSPNEHLKEARLAEHFGCTRGPIREALNKLEQQGFVALVPNQGATVKEPSADEVRDFYNLLAVIEGKAVEWATPLMHPKDIDRLKKINRSLKKVLEAKERVVEEWIPLNLEFHRLFRERCGNEKMNWLAEEIRIRITRYRYISLIVTASWDYAGDHERIVELVSEKKAEKAGEMMENHIHRAKDILVQFLSKAPARRI